MSFLNRIFRSNMVKCPRCLGKGEVDNEDIKRLKKELFWVPGKCAYCNGNGKIPRDRIEKVSVDFEYLTTDLPSWERHKVINQDAEALKRADTFKEFVLDLIQDIERLYYIENMESSQIADHLLEQHSQQGGTGLERQEIIEYIENVITSKRKN